MQGTVVGTNKMLVLVGVSIGIVDLAHSGVTIVADEHTILHVHLGTELAVLVAT